MKNNPLLKPYIFFPYKDLEPDHLDEIIPWMKDYGEKFLQKMEQDTPPTWDNTLGEYVDFQFNLMNVVSPIFHLESVKSKPEFKEKLLNI